MGHGTSMDHVPRIDGKGWNTCMVERLWEHFFFFQSWVTFTTRKGKTGDKIQGRVNQGERFPRCQKERGGGIFEQIRFSKPTRPIALVISFFLLSPSFIRSDPPRQNGITMLSLPFGKIERHLFSESCFRTWSTCCFFLADWRSHRVEAHYMSA